MNAAQIHLALNHAPLFLSLAGGVLLVIGMIQKNGSLKKMSLYFLIAAACSAVPVFLTGEGTEELVEHLPAVDHDAIEEHEEMAKISLIIIIITGVVALAAVLFRKRTGIANLIPGIALVLSLASFGAMAQTAHLGGLIRHSELQNGATNNSEKAASEREDSD
jgi:uncharacterized membrane protein